MKEASGARHDLNIMVGEFGEADPEITKTTDKKFYNIEFSIEFGKIIKEPGVVSKDGLKITTKSMFGICTM
jgi:hypothetical protein